MLVALRSMWRRDPTPAMAQRIVEAQREALFTPVVLTAATRRIDPKTASLQDIETALLDCRFFWAHTYPEIDHELVEWIEAACLQAIEDRFARHGTVILNTIYRRIYRGRD